MIATSSKYKLVRGKKYRGEHRNIMHELDPRENEDELIVHHIDGNKGNNDPDNLVWMTQSEHMKLHLTGAKHFPCDGENNANYRHGMCVGGQSKEYRQLHNKKSYQAHREERLAKQNAYGAAHRDHKRWYDKVRYWENALAKAESEDRKSVCEHKLEELKGAVIQ